MNKIILITGATSGIGKACAEIFAQHGHDLIITGRRNDRLNEIASQLRQNFNIQVNTLNFDVRNKKEVNLAIESLPLEWKSIEILINNAGLAAGLDPVHEGNFDDWEQMIDTNLKGLLYVSKAIIPLMIRNERGHIVNIGSIAGKEVYPNGNVYCATKHGVDALTKGMRMDLLKYGIKVTQIAPGLVETEFSVVRFKGDRERADKVYHGYSPLLAEDVAGAVYYATSLPARVTINDLVIMPTAQASATLVNKK